MSSCALMFFSDIWQKSPIELADKQERRYRPYYPAYGKRLTTMFIKLKKNGLPLKPNLFTLRWYPSSRSCVNSGGRKVKPHQMPPLMVRKAEWRR